MLIAHVHITVATTDREKALNILLNEVTPVRAMKGCLTYIPFIDPTNDTGLVVLHEWQSNEDFAAYATSTEFAKIGQELRPMMNAPPVSKRFDVAPIETIN